MTKKESRTTDNNKKETAKSDLKSKHEQWSQTRELVDERLTEFDLLKSTADEAIDSKQKEIGEFVNHINEDVKEMQNTAKEVVNTVIEGSEGIQSWLDNIYDRALKWGFVVIGVAIALFYVNFFISFGFTLDLNSLVSLSVFSIFIIYYLLMQIFNSRISEDSYVYSKLIAAREKTKEFLKTRLNLKPANLDQMKNAVKNVKSVGERTLSVFRDFIPHADKYYSALERENNQENFKRTLSNALFNYGLKRKDVINDYLRKFSPLTNTESEWLNKASSELSKILNITRVFILLIYSDYVGDNATSNNSWNTIKGDGLSDFVRMLIQNEIVATEYFDSNCANFGSIEELIQDEKTFSLEKFKSLYHQFYFDLAQEKISLLNAIRNYMIDVSPWIDERVRKFVPTNLKRENSREELFKFLSEQLGTSKEIIQLAFYEYEIENNNRIKTWSIIKKDAILRLELINLLVEKKLFDIPSQYRANIQELTRYIDNKLKSSVDFTLKLSNSKLRDEFKSLEQRKKFVARSLTYNNLNIESEDVRDKFQCLLPLNDDEATLSDWLSSKIQIHKNIILLLYYDYRQDDKRQEIFKIIIEKGQTQILARTLLEKNIISKPETNNINLESSIYNLTCLLETQKDFNRRLIQPLFDKSNKLLEYSKKIFRFLETQELITNSDIAFSSVLDLIEKQKEKDTLDILTILVKARIKRDTGETYTEKWLESITLTVLALFLVEREYFLQFEACRKAASNSNATNILYQIQFIHENDERDGKPKSLLKDIVDGVISNEYGEYDFIVPFRDKLSHGSLYPKISLLVEATLKRIDEIVTEKQEKFRRVFNRINKQLQVFLNSQMKYDIVLKSLKMSLVNAYMITGRRGEIFGEIIPYYLPEVCEELAEEDSSYTDFLLHSEEKTGGRGTRLGIVPFGMSFDTFNSKFNEAFKEATKRYVENRARDTVPEDEIAANLIRIMPSEAFFKRVIGGEKTEDVTSEEHPITTIRKLIIEHYSPVRNFELVASLKGGEEATVNMKTLLTELLDTHSRIFLYVEKEVREIVGETGIFEKMKSGEFDNQLIQEFKAKSLSALCVAVYKAQKKGAAYSDSVMVKMTSFVNKLQKKHHKKIGEDQIKLLVEPVIFVLESWGAIIEGFSGEIPELP